MIKVIYRKESDHARAVTEFLHDLEHRTGKSIVEVDPDTREGADFCRVYDITGYPTIIALGEDGQVRNLWSGIPLPLIDEVSAYFS